MKRSLALYITIVVIVAGVCAYLFFDTSILNRVKAITYTQKAEVPEVSISTPTPTPTPTPVAHIPTPKSVKGIYMSQCVVGTKTFREKLVKLIDETEINSVVIDIKDYTGKISFPSDEPILKDSVSNACGAPDMKEFIEELHKKNIYVLGRITVFQSPYHTGIHPEWAIKTQSDPNAVWKDFKGLSFIDVGAKPYWDYIVALSKAAYEIGFDELNYDYIRYPSDGPMAEINSTWGEGKPKAIVLEEFFKYLSENVKPTGAVMSADLFGMTTTNYDDLNIGQVLERAAPYFDFIDPMVYPSHYPKTFLGLDNPNKHPYEVVNYSLEHAVSRLVATTTTTAITGGELVASSTPKLYIKPVYSPLKIRPWLQDFNYGGIYDAAAVRAQIKATYDAGLNSWLLWSASNVYTRDALLTP